VTRAPALALRAGGVALALLAPSPGTPQHLPDALPPSGAGACFDPGSGFDAPLRAPLPGRGGVDHSEHGTRPDGVDWAATRAVVDLPIETLLAKLLDPRNLKAMEKTRLVIREREHPDYLALRRVDVTVRAKALFVGFDVEWTEEWAWKLLEGTRDHPVEVLGNHQKVAGTRHIRRQCGSYLLRRLGEGRTDLFLYDEIDARRRSAKDTRNMHHGILRNIRKDVHPTGRADERVERLEVSAW
jgi:hypothetical protein